MTDNEPPDESSERDVRGTDTAASNAFWMQLGGYPAFVLEVGGRLLGIVYWLDAEALAESGADDVPESGWYFIAADQPRYPERVAHGLEMRSDMTADELSLIVHQALEAVANEILADREGRR